MTGPRVVCFPFVGDDVGGSHISAARLIRRLDPNRYRARVVLEQIDGPLADFLSREGVAFEASPEGVALRPASAPAVLARLATQTATRLRRFLRASATDIVHTNDGRIHTPWALGARAAGLKTLWHHRGDPGARGVNLIAPLLADKIVTVSHYARPRRPLARFDGKWSVVYSPFEHPEPVDRAAARAALAKEVGADRGTRFLGYFGQFIERKRPCDLVDTIVEITRRRPDTPVMAVFFGADAVGREPFEAATRRRAAERGVSERIRFLGFRRPIEPWMAAVDVHVVPALNEPFGRTLIEAMLLGTPVVASAHGGNPEAIRHDETGLLVPPCDPAAFADASLALLDDPALRRRIVEAALAEARTRYGAVRHAARIQALYDDMLGAAPATSGAAMEAG